MWSHVHVLECIPIRVRLSGQRLMPSVLLNCLSLETGSHIEPGIVNCLSYPSIAWKRHHDQSNWQSEVFKWGGGLLWFQRVSSWSSWWVVWQQAGWRGVGAVAERSHLICNLRGEKEKENHHTKLTKLTGRQALGIRRQCPCPSTRVIDVCEHSQLLPGCHVSELMSSCLGIRTLPDSAMSTVPGYLLFFLC